MNGKLNQRWILRWGAAAVLFAVGVMALPSNVSADVRYNRPRIRGAIVDHCTTWAANCGWGGAHMYCRRRGHPRARSWRTFRPGRTWVMGSNRYCVGGFCTGFSQVTCVSGVRPPPTGGRTTINFPRWGGSIVDWCVTWATNCGWSGAHYYCRRRGYSRALSYRTYRPGRTFVIGSNRTCVGGHCVGFSQVVCRRGGYVPPTNQRVRFRLPRIRGAIVDHCTTWATNCGWGGAHMYCRRRGYRQAASWRTYRPGRTWVMGSNRYCNGGFCVGFREVVCRR